MLGGWLQWVYVRYLSDVHIQSLDVSLCATGRLTTRGPRSPLGLIQPHTEQDPFTRWGLGAIVRLGREDRNFESAGFKVFHGLQP